MNAKETIRIARKHLGKGEMESSARLCLEDAIQLYDAGELEAAHRRALKSIVYSVGVLHPDFGRLNKETVISGAVYPAVETAYGKTVDHGFNIRIF